MEAPAPVGGASADGWRKRMEKFAAAVRWIAFGALILAASFAVGGLYQGVAISNGSSAGDVYVFNRFTGAYYVCRNRSCQIGKVSN
jgi:hypothetical protein